jgi:hypothetical protein
VSRVLTLKITQKGDESSAGYRMFETTCESSRNQKQTICRMGTAFDLREAIDVAVENEGIAPLLLHWDLDLYRW